MKKLSRLIIQNFQSHKFSEMTFSPNITVIVGESDQGKSGIVRSIEQVLKNKHKAVENISRWAKKSTNTVAFDSGEEITRERTKTVNRYFATDINGTQLTFQDFGLTIPEEVVSIVGKTEVQIDPELAVDLSFASQLEGPFLVTQSPFVKARIIDGLAKVNVFNRALKNANIKLTRLNIEEKQVNEEIAEIQEQLLAFNSIKEEAERIKTIKKLIEQFEALKEKAEWINQLYSQQQFIETQIVMLNEEIERLEPSIEAGHMFMQLKILSLDSINKNKYLISLQNINRDIQLTQRTIDSLENIFEVEERVQQLNSLFKEKSSLSQKQTLLVNINREEQECLSIVANKDKVLEAEEYLKMLVQNRQKVENYSGLKSTLLVINKDIEECNSILNDQEKVMEADILKNDLFAKINIFNQLNKLLASLIGVNREIDSTQSIVDKYKNVGQAEGLIDTLKNSLLKYNAFMNLLSNYVALTDRVIKGNAYVHSVEKELNTSQNMYKLGLKELKVCPICLSALTEEHIEEIFNK